MNAPWPFEELTTRYRTIVADPPWHPEMRGRAHPKHQYTTMTFDEIADLPVEYIAANQAHLYLWCLNSHVHEGYETVEAWGFEDITMLTWCKPGLGAGRFRCNTEHVIVARRGTPVGNPFGSMGQTGQATDGTWFQWPRGGHSEKPAAFFDLVEHLSPGPYIELFARSPRLGWDSWGLGYESDRVMPQGV